MKTITIGRQYGSGGREVGAMLAKSLNIPFYDSNLLLIAAEKYGINPGVMAEHDEKKQSSFLYGISMIADGYLNQEKIMLPYKLYQAQSDTILRLVEEGPCVFVGRCAEHILKKHDYKNLLSVFIYASSMEERAERAMTVDHISQKEVYSYIAQKDRERKDYYYFHTGNDWGKVENYDLCLNTSALGYAGCAEIIKKVAQVS